MANTEENPFYNDGLRFSCINCSECCRFDPGYVFLSGKDLELLAEGLQMRYSDVMERYCRWAPSPDGGMQLSLKEKPGFDCVFWQDGCEIYRYRPLQCRTFPFWKSILCSREIWEGLSCPGINNGTLYSREYIENCLAQRRADPVLTRSAS